ncbi:hypothetical protein [Pontixanthobacter sp.]|uniref:hypothetical protein n=1 Tax=Pontixanthobacter sp. TaxID=2792078 RepID=UPI003C7C8B3E
MVANFQSSVSDEVTALQNRLSSAEAGNYVSVYYDNDGDPSVVFEFLRDGPGTLRKYTQHPRFFGKTVQWSMEQLMADARWMWTTFKDDRVIQSTGTGRGNRVNAEINVSEPEFRALVARKGVTIPESVVLSFRAGQGVPLDSLPQLASVDDAVPPIAAPHIRIFPRADRPQGPVNLIESRVDITLQDGCFRAAGRDNALVLFPIGATLFVDAENYLAFGSGVSPGYARVGEKVTFTGSINEVTTPELVAPIHAACGKGKVIMVGGLASAAARDAQDRVSSRAIAVRSLRDRYGLDPEQAERAVVWLERRNAAIPRGPENLPSPPISIGMIIDVPPPPVFDPSTCPSGTSLSGALCRTPEGYLRPLPDWLQQFMEQD